MRRVEGLLKRFGDYPLAVEMRHGTWQDERWIERLRERGAGFCNIDQPVIGRSMKATAVATGKVGYVRLHGRRYDTWFSEDPKMPPAERYNYLYTAKELEPWGKRIEEVAKGSETTFVITNNHYQGKGVVNALELMRLLTEKPVKVPEELRRAYPRLEEIASEGPRAPTLFAMGPKE